MHFNCGSSGFRRSEMVSKYFSTGNLLSFVCVMGKKLKGIIPSQMENNIVIQLKRVQG